MKYEIICGDSTDQLEEIVNYKILAGFEPIGGVTVIHSIYIDHNGDTDNNFRWCQSLINKDIPPM